MDGGINLPGKQVCGGVHADVMRNVYSSFGKTWHRWKWGRLEIGRTYVSVSQVGFSGSQTLRQSFGVQGIYEGSTSMKEGVKPALDRRKVDLQCRPGLMSSGVNSAPQLSHTRAKLAGHLNLHHGPLEGHGPGVSLQLRKT